MYHVCIPLLFMKCWIYLSLTYSLPPGVTSISPSMNSLPPRLTSIPAKNAPALSTKLITQYQWCFICNESFVGRPCSSTCLGLGTILSMHPMQFWRYLTSFQPTLTYPTLHLMIFPLLNLYTPMKYVPSFVYLTSVPLTRTNSPTLNKHPHTWWSQQLWNVFEGKMFVTVVCVGGGSCLSLKMDVLLGSILMKRLTSRTVAEQSFTNVDSWI